MTSLMTGADALLDDLDTLTSEFLAVLNDKERERRVHVNSHHFGQYGRTLYPEGSTYCTYVAEAGGRKYQRIVQVLTDGGSRSVHCFIDKQTGDVLKAAGWKAPASGARFNLLDAASRADLFERCEFTGAYLYRGARR